MQIEPLSQSPLGLAGMPGAIGGRTGAGAPLVQARERREEAGGEPESDRYARGGPPGEDSEDAPFWLLMWQADRRAGRRQLGARERKRAEALEAAWIKDWLAAVAPELAAWRVAAERPRLAAWQTVTDALVAAAGPFSSPMVVFQPLVKHGRGQFIFRHPRALIQLAPQAPGTPGEWYGTLAHESMHHAQYELVARLYQGQPLPSPWLELARYYRDAVAVYRMVSPAYPPERHRAQDLERGPWKLGEAVARAIDA